MPRTPPSGGCSRRHHEEADGAVHPASRGAEHDYDAELRVQLLVQACTATALLVEGAVRRAATEPAATTTAELLAATLRDDPPVRLTRRVDPDGASVVLRFDGADRDGSTGPPTAHARVRGGTARLSGQWARPRHRRWIVEEVRVC